MPINGTPYRGARTTPIRRPSRGGGGGSRSGCAVLIAAAGGITAALGLAVDAAIRSIGA